MTISCIEFHNKTNNGGDFKELMLQHNIDESDVFEYKQEQKSEAVIDTVIYQGRPQKWLYRLASIIAENFRVHTYYVSGSPIELRFVGIESDVQIAQIIFEYARGSAGYCARQFLQLPEIRRKYKRKWQLKQDYIEGYLVQNHALIRRAVELAHEAGLKVCIDLASYNIVQDDREFFAELLLQTDIVFANEQEAQAFTGIVDAQTNVEALARLCEIAVVKIGKKGVLVRRGEEQIHCPAREVPHVVDTTAAGDYFSAGFLYALATGCSLMQCAALGSLLAGHIIEVVGTALSAETWQKIKAEALPKA